DADADVGVPGLRRHHEHRLGEVHLLRERLHGQGVEIARVGEDRELVPAEGFVGEDIRDDVTQATHSASLPADYAFDGARDPRPPRQGRPGRPGRAATADPRGPRGGADARGAPGREGARGDRVESAGARDRDGGGAGRRGRPRGRGGRAVGAGRHGRRSARGGRRPRRDGDRGRAPAGLRRDRARRDRTRALVPDCRLRRARPLTRTLRPMQAAIRVAGLTKRYGSHEALRGIDFEIAAGEVFGLLGPNGAGKTTTIEILEGYRNRDAGEVEVLGEDPQRADRAWRERVGVVLQSSSLYPSLTARESLRIFAGYYLDPRDPDEVVELVGLA